MSKELFHWYNYYVLYVMPTNFFVSLLEREEWGVEVRAVAS